MNIRGLSYSIAPGSVLSTAVLTCLVVWPLTSPMSAQRRTFTVEDAIKMTTFVDPYPAKSLWPPNDDFKISPNGQLVAVVAQRNLLGVNGFESTLWVFDARALATFIRSDSSTTAPKPTELTRIISSAEGDDAPAITKLRWLQEDRIAFLGHGKQEVRSLYIANTKTKKCIRVTPLDQDVTQFDIVGDTIVYTIRESTKPESPNLSEAQPRAVVGTGHNIFSLLFPAETKSDVTEKFSELWLIRGGRRRPVVDTRTKEPLRIPTPVHGDTLSLSPSGRSVIATQRPSRIPETWEAYRPFPSSFGNSIQFKATPAGAERDNNALIAEQFSTIDLDSGRMTALLDAPIGRSLLYYTPQKAIWSQDEGKVLLVNTFLPLSGVSEAEKQLRSQRPCVAVVDVNTHKATCVAPVRQHTGEQHLQAGAEFYCLIDAVWSKDGQTIILRYYTTSTGDKEDNHPPEIYHHVDGLWRLVRASTVSDRSLLMAANHLIPPQGLSLSIHEDLNTPETLYVSDPFSRKTKELWNPNPFLNEIDMGEASIYRWKDSTGRNWVGGLVKPPDYKLGRRYPLVIQTHGFDQHKFLSTGPYTSANAARALAAKEMIVLQVPDSHDGYLTAKEPLVHLQGIEAAIDQLGAQGLIDPQRVGLIGFSRTCFYVLFALEKAPERFAAATIADGTTFGYMQYLLDADNPSSGSQFKRQVAAIIGGQPFGGGLKMWLQESPGFNLDKIKAPVRVEAYGKLSLVLNWDPYGGLRVQRKPVDLIFFPYASHVIARPQERLASEQGNVEWFDFWLNNGIDPDPAKTDQYSRWQQIRKENVTASRAENEQ